VEDLPVEGGPLARLLVSHGQSVGEVAQTGRSAVRHTVTVGSGSAYPRAAPPPRISCSDQGRVFHGFHRLHPLNGYVMGTENSEC
jgi:hypothetical protein